MSSDLLADIYNAFDPFEPLPADSHEYVDCQEVRGDANVLVDLGKKILRSDRTVCQLYAGHRGAGKSTELLRLKQDLENKGCLVVYFAADEDDIDPEDAQYTDILLACTRHLLEALKNSNPNALSKWLNDCWDDLQDLALTEINFTDVKVEVLIAQFAKLSANIRAVPSERRKIRDKVNPHTVTLLEALNEFIKNAKINLPNGKSQLVVIADNLDRIVINPQEGGRTNHDEIFLDREGQLRGLDCHVIYTVPISMVYSNRAADLRDIYSDPHVLPMIMVKTPDGAICEAGLQKLKEIIHRRVQTFAPDRSLETEIFSSNEALEQLCLTSGGHVRNLMLLMRSEIDYILPSQGRIRQSSSG
jgi:AAA ATPase domain